MLECTLTDKERFYPLCLSCLEDFCEDEYNHGFAPFNSTKEGIAYTTSDNGEIEYQVYISMVDLRVWREELSTESCTIGFDVSFPTYAAMYDWLIGNLDFNWLIYQLKGVAIYD